MIKTSDISIIKETFQKIADMVTPTMGAKGRMAIIEDEFSRPLLTDDGVTVAKMALNEEGFARMVALSMVEAAHNTEKTAFDGTTLTILLTNELYKTGLSWIEAGMHAQNAADLLLECTAKARKELEKYRIPLDESQVANLSTIVTKIPAIGALVAEAYNKSRKTMNVAVEHERFEEESSVEYTSGMALDAGYMSESLKSLCNEGDVTHHKNAHIAVLKEGIFTQQDVHDLFASIPDEAINEPFIFIVSNKFNPESLKLLIDTLASNKIIFQFIFINDIAQEELFLDIAAYCGGVPQDSLSAASGYTFDKLGFANEIIIEQTKTVITSERPDVSALDQRIASYKKELDTQTYVTGMNRSATITRRLSNLESGVTKIKIYAPTVTEYLTIKLKLDDAIGAVKAATKHGITIGAGKAMWNTAKSVQEIKDALQAPLRTIISNAGLDITPEVAETNNKGINVVTKETVDLIKAGIVDSYASIDTSLKNAASIAANYLRAYILIRKD